MKVSDLAKEYGLKSEDILAELKSFKMKAVNAQQELSVAGMAIVRRSLDAKGKKAIPLKKEEGRPMAPKPKWAHIDVKEPEEKKTSKTSKAKKTSEKKEKSVKAPKKAIEKKSPATEKKPAGDPKKAKQAKAPVASKEKVQVSAKEKVQKKPVVPIATVAAPEKPVESVTARPQPAVAQPASPVVKPVPSQVEIVIPKYSDHRRPRHSESHRPFRSEHHRPQLAEVIVSQRPSREVELSFPINVKDLSVKIQQKPSAILKVLMQKGVLATINQNLTEEVILKIQEDLSFTHRVAKTEEEQLFALHTENDDPSLLKPRPPVITFMGHVDHGKTSLLDRIRKSNVVDQEHGGITQHMAAYSVETARGKITFLDTPGHAAFTAMRARGAHITDIVILVVAADEGVMPQTEEAIDHARAANVPIVVAINKIDKRNINLDRVKKQLSEKDLMPEDWGGKTITVGVSATTGEGVDKLLEMILLEAEILELKANYDRPATGIVVEAHLSHGRGSVASVIVQAGTLKDGDIVVAGPYSGRIKAMLDDHGRALKVATPAVPLEILGLGGVPEAGELFYVVSDEKKAREICEMRSEQIKNKRLQSAQRITLEDLYSQIQQGKVKDLNIILKTDVQGSLEALKDSLIKLSNDEVQIKFLHTGIGEINAADVILAQVSNAIIVGFQVEADVKAKEELAKQSVDIRTYRIIYDAVDDIKKALSGLLEPKIRKKFTGRVDIRQVFKLSKSGVVAGCFVQKGRIDRKAKIAIMRNGQEIFTGEIDSLKRFKDDVREVKEGFECGITLRGFTGIEVGDVIEAYELETIQREL
ncbi:MAG TPA: translation initiation factor IF-2 [Candidatus Omnitrophota bacterium]|nr:translation initiation factor IF-2 [Candidatus Omnitrophota bacterium]